MEKKKVVGIDFDDVLFIFYENLRIFHNELYGSAHTKEEYVHYELADVWKCEKHEVGEHVIAFYESTHHPQMQPTPGAVAALEKLHEKYELKVVTARIEEVKQETVALLRSHFPMFAEEDVYFTNLQSKRTICEEIGVDLFIDDALHNAVDIAAPHRPVLLLDNPWNQGELPPYVNRVYSWSDALQYIEGKGFDAPTQGD